MAKIRRWGRKRKAGVKRYPSGQIAYEKPDEVAVAARMRLLGLSKTAARHPDAGHALGIVLRNREVTRSQFMAGMAYLEARALYRQSVLTPKIRCESDFDGVRGHDDRSGEEMDYVAFCARAVRRYRDMRRVVLEAGPLAMMGLETWLEHTDMTSPLPYCCLGDYRLAANALCQLLRIEEKDGKNERKGLTYGERCEI